MKAIKVISPGVPGDLLLTEAILAHNSRIRQETRLPPFQLVTGKQSTLSPIDDTGERTHSFINRLKHLGLQVPDNQGWDLQEVTIQFQHTPCSLVACSVGLNDSSGSPNQDENLGVELVNKREPQKFANSSYSKPYKCGKKNFSRNFPNKEKRKKQRDKNVLFKEGLNKPPTPPAKGGMLKEEFL